MGDSSHMIIWAIKRLVVSWQKFAFFIIKAVQGQFRSNKVIPYSFLGNQSESSTYLLRYFYLNFFSVFKNLNIFRFFQFSKIKISKYFEYLEISDFENGSGSGSESDETQKLKKVSLHICNQ